MTDGEGSDPAATPAESEEGWTIVTVADTLLEAEVAADFLEAADMAVAVESVGDRSNDVLVHEEDLERARELIRSLREGEGEAPLRYRARIQAAKKVYEGRAILHAGGEEEEALARFVDAVALDPRCASAHAGIAGIHYRLRRNPEAYEELQKAVAIDDHDRNAWILLAKVCLNLERPGEAREVYRKVLEIYPDDVRAHRGLGMAFSWEWRVGEALAAFEEALDIDPDDVDSIVQAGIAKYRLGDVEAAIGMAARVLEIDSENVPALMLLGRAKWRAGRFADSERALVDAVKLGRGNPEPVCYLANTHIDQGRFDDAKKLLDPVIAKSPNHAFSKLTLARLHDAEKSPLRDPAAAEQLFREAVRISPRNAEYHRMLADFLEKAGKREEARAEAEEAVRIAPEIPLFQETLARLRG